VSDAVTPQLLFEVVEGLPIPRLPRETDNAPREPGDRYLTLLQTVQATGRPESELRDAYLAMLADQVCMMTPGSPAPAAVESSADRLALLKRTRYPHLSDADFGALLEFARQHNLNPWSDHVWAAPDADGTVKPMATNAGLRAIAMRTGQYGGRLGPFWCGPDGEWKDVWLSDDPPYAAKVGILRKGITDPFWSIARFKGYARYDAVRGRLELNERWQKMPDQMLAKCSESGGLRAAFGDVLAGMYSFEEMMQAGNPAAPTPPPGWSAFDADSPQTLYQLRITMANAGIKDEGKRGEIIGAMRRKFGQRYADDEAAFCVAVWREILRRPGEYGAKV
jgi:phage recombination protein Bet